MDFVLSEKNPKRAFELFYDKINSLTESAFPEVTKKGHNKEKINFPWFTNGLKISNQRKFELASLKARKPTLENKVNYKNFLSIYNKLIRKAKILHYKDIFEKSKNNMKKSWNTIFELIGSKKNKQELPDYFIKNGRKNIRG